MSPGDLIVERGSELVYPAVAVFDQARAYRYLLTRQWAEGPLAVFVMLNPSTADAFHLDPTVTRCVSFARRERCGRLAVVNLFALRSTGPQALLTHSSPIGPGNDQVIRQVCTPGTLVIAGWGVWGTFHGRAAEVTRMLQAAGTELKCLGFTKRGDPRHPLYVPAGTPLQTYQNPGASPTIDVRA